MIILIAFTNQPWCVTSLDSRWKRLGYDAHRLVHPDGNALTLLLRVRSHVLLDLPGVSRIYGLWVASCSPICRNFPLESQPIAHRFWPWDCPENPEPLQQRHPMLRSPAGWLAWVIPCTPEPFPLTWRARELEGKVSDACQKVSNKFCENKILDQVVVRVSLGMPK